MGTSGANDLFEAVLHLANGKKADATARRERCRALLSGDAHPGNERLSPQTKAAADRARDAGVALHRFDLPLPPLLQWAFVSGTVPAAHDSTYAVVSSRKPRTPDGAAPPLTRAWVAVSAAAAHATSHTGRAS